MATVQFRNDPKGISINKRLPIPKKVSRLEAWFKQSRKIIPEIPNPVDTDWRIASEEATLQYVKFTMVNSIGERCYVVIDRKADGLR